MLTEKAKRFLILVSAISFGMSILVHFNSIFLFFTEGSNDNILNNGRDNITEVLSNIITTTVLTFSIFLINYIIIKPHERLQKLGVKRILGAALFTVFSTLLLSELFFFINHAITNNEGQGEAHLFYFLKDIFIAFVVFLSVYILKVFNERQAMLIENEKIKLENLKSRHQSLRNQVSPHFLFNSLAALDELIGTDPLNARNYVTHLSRILRSTLQRNDDITITLSEEMETVKSYLFLVSIRFGTSLKINLKTDNKYDHYRLPPLVVQTLIENAVKHNEVSKRHPLLINISTTGNSRLLVSNSLRPRLTPEPGSGIGLTNISVQYKLLSGEDIRISRSESEFEVEIPLIKPL
jgi:hypothetical protein